MTRVGSIASALHGRRHVFLRDMVLTASIGIHAHEHGLAQRVRINVDLAVEDPSSSGEVAHETMRGLLLRVVDYESVATRIRGIVAAGHVGLVETLAERIAESCLEDLRVQTARVRVEKLDIFPDAASAGVEIERRQFNLSTSRDLNST